MTDFTKYELENLLSWGNVYTDFGTSWTFLFHEPLLEKIQSMIDNYCEHECNHEWDGILISNTANMGKCKKCSTICYIAIPK